MITGSELHPCPQHPCLFPSTWTCLYPCLPWLFPSIYSSHFPTSPFPPWRCSHPCLFLTPPPTASMALCSPPTHTGFYLICPYNRREWTPGFRATQAEKATEEGGAGRSTMCVKRETISGIIFDWLPLFENYFQSMMSHCGSRIKLNKAAGGRSRGGAVLYIQAYIQGSFGQCRLACTG